MRIGNQAAVLAVSRLANYGLMLIGPIVLVRLMPVEDFGRYREFLVYAGLLYALAAFSIHEALLFFIPSNPGSPWRMVRQAVVLTAISSVIVVAALVAIDALMHGGLVGGFLLPLALYTLVLANFDFWEYLLIATHRPALVLLYSGTRLGVRMLATIIAAALSHRIDIIIWSLVGVEGIRCVVSAIVWRRLDQSAREPVVPNAWREQLRYCMPTGATMLLALARRNICTLAVARFIGPVALAYWTTGKYGEPVVTVLRSSLTAAILPEMVRRGERQPQSSLALWRRATVVNAIIIFPIAVLAGRYAEPLVTVIFGEDYRPAAILMQLYMLVLVRECFDYSPLLRSMGRTRSLVYPGVVGLAAGVVALWFLIPAAGVIGAMVAFVIASFAEAIALAIAACGVYGVGVRQIVPWWGIGRVALACAVASAVLFGPFWTATFGPAGIVLASACYVALFALLTALLRIAEAFTLFEWVRRLGFSRAEARSH